MAYIIGLCSAEEIEELERRGWKIEEPPKKLVPKHPTVTHKMCMVWVDSSMFDVMNGPDWDKGLSPIPLFAAWNRK